MTPRRNYRLDITVADAGVLAVEETLDLENLQDVTNPSRDGGNIYGHNLVLFIYALMAGFSAVTIQLWIKAEVQAIPRGVDPNAPSSSSSSSPSESSLPPPGTEDWALVDSRAISSSQMLRFGGLTPGKYRVVVSAATGGPGQIDIREQHSE